MKCTLFIVCIVTFAGCAQFVSSFCLSRELVDYKKKVNMGMSYKFN